MTNIFINNKPAILPEDLSVTLRFENPYFTRTSNYSLDVELPMPANYSIFGHINRLDVRKQKIILPAKVIIDGKVLLDGSAVLVGMYDRSVKIQLVSGNAEFNILTNTNVYIDELDLGEIVPPQAPQNGYPFSNDKKKEIYGSVDKVQSVWLPVMYETGKWYNEIVYIFGYDTFDPRPYYRGCCVQPYLLVVIKKVIENFGYKVGDNYIDQTWMRNLYIVSAVQTNQISKALPHWTVSEFFNEIEKFCGVITVVDEINKTISLVDVNTYYSFSGYAYIENVLSEFETEVEDKSESKDVTTGNVGYQLPSGTDDGYWRMDRDLVQAAVKTEFDSYDQLLAYYNALSDENKKYALLICGNRYYMNFKDGNSNSLKEINLYANLIRDVDKDDLDAELKIMPAKIVKQDIGLYNYTADYLLGTKFWPLVLNMAVASYSTDLSKMEKINIQDVIEGNQQLDKDRNKKEIMELAIYTGDLHPVEVNYKNQLATFHYPVPYTDYKQIVPGQKDTLQSYSLSLNDFTGSLGNRIRSLQKINSNLPYTMQFERRWIPKLNQVFVINNKKYVAQKIEATLTAKELNPILEGTFYRIED